MSLHPENASRQWFQTTAPGTTSALGAVSKCPPENDIIRNIFLKNYQFATKNEWFSNNLLSGALGPLKGWETLL